MDIDRLQSVGLVIIRPKSPQSDRKSDLLKIFRPECVKILYPSKFDEVDIVSSDWLKFRRIFRYNNDEFAIIPL